MAHRKQFDPAPILEAILDTPMPLHDIEFHGKQTLRALIGAAEQADLGEEYNLKTKILDCIHKIATRSPGRIQAERELTDAMQGWANVLNYFGSPTGENIANFVDGGEMADAVIAAVEAHLAPRRHH